MSTDHVMLLIDADNVSVDVIEQAVKLLIDEYGAARAPRLLHRRECAQAPAAVRAAMGSTRWSTWPRARTRPTSRWRSTPSTWCSPNGPRWWSWPRPIPTSRRWSAACAKRAAACAAWAARRDRRRDPAGLRQLRRARTPQPRRVGHPTQPGAQDGGAQVECRGHGGRGDRGAGADQDHGAQKTAATKKRPGRRRQLAPARAPAHKPARARRHAARRASPPPRPCWWRRRRSKPRWWPRRCTSRCAHRCPRRWPSCSRALPALARGDTVERTEGRRTTAPQPPAQPQQQCAQAVRPLPGLVRPAARCRAQARDRPQDRRGLSAAGPARVAARGCKGPRMAGPVHGCGIETPPADLISRAISTRAP